MTKACVTCGHPRCPRGKCSNCKKAEFTRRFFNILFRHTTTIVEAELHKNTTEYRMKAKCIHGICFTRLARNVRRNKLYECICNKFELQKQRTEETCMKKYGHRNVMQVPEFFQKARRTAFESKRYIWPSGRVTMYQGYENWLYEQLLLTFSENEIVTEKLQTFQYVDADGDTRTYFPDAQVGNVVYEVKSWYTYGLQKEITERKVEAVVAAKYTAEVWIFEKKSIFFRRISHADGRKELCYPESIFTDAILAAAPNTVPI